MRTCAVIVSYRTGPALGQCLASIASAAALDEIVLVDNGNPASETKLIDAFCASEPRARLLRGHGNIGFAAACNMGARNSGGDVLVFVNPDVVLATDAIKRLAAAVAASGGPVLVGGDLRDPAGAPDRGGRRDRLTLWRAVVSVSGMSRLEGVLPALRDYDRQHDPLPEAPMPVSAVSGALMAMGKSDFMSIGGFDEGYFLHVEDLDLCRRAEEAGWAVLFQPGPHGVHLRSTSSVESGAIARHKALGAARYFRKFARTPLEKAVAGLAGAVLETNARLIGR